MPSRQVTRSNYRKAKCCGNCKSENKRYCGHHCMPVSQDMVCDDHEDDPDRMPARTLCSECRYGKSGDHTCSDGCIEDTPEDAGCFAGARRTR